MARLGHPLVGQETLAAFRRWRETPENDAAYRALQATNRASAGLANDPDIRTALSGARRARATTHPSRRAVLAAGGALSLAALGALVGLALMRPLGDAYQTTIGERSFVHLADGSSVQLDTDSRLRVRLEHRIRRLTLERGQAYFDVAHDVDRPFVVTAGSVQVTATGTRFDVRRDGGGSAHVILEQGRVVVRDHRRRDAASWTLAPGQVLAAGGPTPPRPAAVGDSAPTSWTSGRLTFRNASLTEVLAEANRYTRQPLALGDDPGLSTLRVDGVFVAGDTAGLVSALHDLYGLRPVPGPNGRLTLRPATRPS